MISKQAFGQTGHLSSRILLGAAAFSKVTQYEADGAIELALSYGLNHIDVAASYGDAELRIGNWINRHGRDFFLATKTGARTAEEARQDIRRSLERLQVDCIDLIQFHNLIDPLEWENVFSPGGALEAVIEAREQGLVRFIGVTGHGVTAPVMHRRALERFNFDSILLPFSYIMAQNDQYLSDFNGLVKICQSRNIAVQTIKSLVHKPWGDDKPTHATWYRPLKDQGDIDMAVHWLLGHQGLFLNSTGDVHILPRLLEAAENFSASPSDSEMNAMAHRLGMQPLFT